MGDQPLDPHRQIGEDPPTMEMFYRDLVDPAVKMSPDTVLQKHLQHPRYAAAKDDYGRLAMKNWEKNEGPKGTWPNSEEPFRPLDAMI